MANTREKITVELDVDSRNSVKSIGVLEDEFERLNNEIKNVEIGTQAFKELKAEIQRVDGQLRTAEDSLRGMSFTDMASASSQLAGGIGDVAGAFMLFGDESSESMEELQANLNRVVGLVMGVTGAVDIAEVAMKNFGTVSKIVNNIWKTAPIGVIVASVAALSAGVVLLTKKLKEAKDEQNNFTSTIKEANINIETEKLQMNQLFEELKNVNPETERARKLREKLNTEYGEYLPNQIKETTNLEDISKWQEQANLKLQRSILLKAKEQVLQQQLEPLYERQAEALVELRDGLQDVNYAEEQTDGTYERINLTKEQADEFIRLGVEAQQAGEYMSNVDKLVEMGFSRRRAQIIAESDEFEDLLGNIKEYNVTSAQMRDVMTNVGQSFDFLIPKIKETGDETEETEDKTKKLNKEIKKTGDIVRENVPKMADYKNRILNQLRPDEKDIEETKSAWEMVWDITQDTRSEMMEGTDTDDIESKSVLSSVLGMEEDTAQATVDAFNSIIDKALSGVYDVRMDKMKQFYDSQKELIDENMQRELDAVEGNESAQQAIRKKYAKKQIELEKQQAREEKQLKIQQMLLDQAFAIAQIWIQTLGTNPLATGVAIAQTAALVAQTGIQLAVMKNTKFADGGIINGASHSQGGIATPFGEVEGGEAIINKRSVDMFGPLLSRINEAGGGVPLTANGMADQQFIDYDLLASKINDKKVYVVDRDITNQQYQSARISDRAKF